MAGDRRPTPLWMVVRNLKNRERARGRKKHEFVMCVTYRQRIFRHIPDRRCFLLGSPRHSGDLGRPRTGGYVEQCGGLAASLEWGAALCAATSAANAKLDTMTITSPVATRSRARARGEAASIH